MKKYLPLVVFCSLIIIAVLSIGEFYDSYSNGGGSPESKSLGGIIGLVVAIPFFVLWCCNIIAFYGTYRFFLLNGKSKKLTIIFVLFTGIGFYFLREEFIGEDGILPFYILYTLNLISLFLPSSLKR